MIITCLVLWVLYAIAEGIREAYYFDCFPSLPKKFDIHVLFAFQRGVVIFALAQADWFLVLPMMMMFPFVHDGVYYWFRNKLNVVIYQKKFWSDPSSTSTAILDFNVHERIILFAGAITVIIVRGILTANYWI